MLSEERIAKIIDDAFGETLYQYLLGSGPVAARRAAHAIAEKLAEGVVAQDTATAGVMHYTSRDAMLCLNSDRLQVQVFQLSEDQLSELAGRALCVTVTREESDGPEAG